MFLQYNMQHRILDQCLVAQVVPQALLNVQLMVPVSDKIDKERQNVNDKTPDLQQSK